MSTLKVDNIESNSASTLTLDEKVDITPSSIGTVQVKARFTDDGMPNTENDAAWLRVEYDDADTSPRSIDLSFYGFGELFRFSGDGSTANNSRSVLEFWGQDQAPNSNPYRPIMTLVCGINTVEHEVHAVRKPDDTDAIILSYLDGGTMPAIFTETGQAAALDFGVRRTRRLRVTDTGISVSRDATALAETDSSSLIQIGTGDNNTATRSNIRIRNGGYSAPSAVNVTADGDKFVFWNNSTLKIAQGIDDSTFWFQINATIGTPTFKWYGGTGSSPVLHMTLSQTGALSLLSNALILNATGIPAGGTAGAGYKFSSTSNFGVFFGSGAPSLSAAKGSLYLRSDGSGTTDRAYINTDGGTTWTALTTVA